MADEFDPISFLAMAELSQLKAQAFDIFDRCLAENNAAPIVAFIERQLMSDPPHLPLLRDFSEGLHQRLMSLRVNHYDVRNNVIKAFHDYGIDITPLTPANALLQYHLTEVDDVMNLAREQGKTLSDTDFLMLSKLLEASLNTAKRLNSEIKLVIDLQTFLNDWLEAHSATVGRRFWSDSDRKQSPRMH